MFYHEKEKKEAALVNDYDREAGDVEFDEIEENASWYYLVGNERPPYRRDQSPEEFWRYRGNPR